MNREQILRLIDEGGLKGLTVSDVGEIDGNVVIRNLVPLALESVSCSFSTTNDPIIRDTSGQSLGTLCMLKGKGVVQVEQFTEWQRAAYLTDAEADSVGENYLFQHDYLVLDVDKYETYKAEYKEIAPLWGRFVHMRTDGGAAPCCKIDVEAITAQTGIVWPTNLNRIAARRAILCAHAYDRYLRFYHQLELIFDWIVYRQIQLLGDDLKDYAGIMSRYRAEDLSRLKYLVREYCADDAELQRGLVGAANYRLIATDAFHNFSKEGDPLKEERKWEAFWTLIDTSDLNPAAAKRANLAQTQDQYGKLIRDVAAYWIYRIRSSIAHSRIGEFLLRDEDEEFVAGFGEPLLVGCLMQVFSNPAVVALVK